MRRCNFDELAGNDGFKQQATALLSGDRLPGALLIAGEDGCGRNLAARLVAMCYLGDSAGLVSRGQHPDCLVIEGEGASGQIPVGRVREAAYELSKAAVMADGVRVAIVRDAHDLNRHSANALLKTLEQPPSGVLFLLTARRESDLMPTVLSRCVRMRVTPLGTDEAARLAAERHPGYDGERYLALSRMFGGRLGLVERTLGDPELLALAGAAQRAWEAANQRDKLTFLAELDSAEGREPLRWLLFCMLQLARGQIGAGTEVSGTLCRALDRAYGDVGRNINNKLLCSHLAAQL